VWHISHLEQGTRGAIQVCLPGPAEITDGARSGVRDGGYSPSVPGGPAEKARRESWRSN